MKNGRSKIIDLSYPLSSATLAYPGDPVVEIGCFKTIKTHGAAVSKISFGSHAGTHLDAPSHVIENGANLSRLSPVNYFGVGRCVDVRNREQITEQDIPADISAGQAVFFCTGHARQWNNEQYYHLRPCLTVEAVDELLKKRVSMVGIDTPSVDQKGAQEKIIHRKLLGKEVLIFENLANLEQLPFDDMFVYFAGPISVEDGDGAPARVFAFVGDEWLIESVINFKSNMALL